MVISTSLCRIWLERMLSEVFHPERRSVANIAFAVLEARNLNAAKFTAHGAVELRHVYLQRWNRVAIRCRNVFLDELRQYAEGLRFLDAEGVLVAVDEN